MKGPKGTYNAMVFDSGAIAQNGSQGVHDKLRKAFGETYVGAIGDALLLNSLQGIIEWLDPERPRLREPETFHAILGGLERVRALRTTLGHGVHLNPGSAHLLVCSRTEVFYWTSTFDPELGFSRPSEPISLSDGQLIVLRGKDTVAPVTPVLTDFQDPFSHPIEAILQVNESIEAMDPAFKMPYEVTPQMSGVMLPHKTSVALKRLRPFDSLPEQWVRYEGGPGLAFLNDPEFMAMPMPGKP